MLVAFMMSKASTLTPRSSNPKSAIIITTYNHADYLREALDSCMQQTMAVDEVIVVDDGSTDNPAAIVEKYHDVRLIRQDNQGLAAARNTGLSATKAAFVTFLDADDRLLPEAIEVGVRHLESRMRTAMTYGAYRVIDKAGKPISGKMHNPVPGNPYLEFLRRGNFISMHATVVYRRDNLVEIGGFDEKLRACEDYELFLRITKSSSISSHDKLVAEYRKHGRNMSLNSPMMLSTALKVLDAQFDDEIAADEREAITEGKKNWCNHYAIELAKNSLVRVFSRPGMALKMLGQSIWIAPFAFVNFAARSVLRRTLRVVPPTIGRKLFGSYWVPRSGAVEFGDFGRTSPLSDSFGYDRGTPIDRYYIEKFLNDHSSDIRGRVLEIGDNTYTRQFGGNNVLASDILHVNAGNSNATIVGDLSVADVLPSNAFDCIILTQTLHLIFDMPKAISSLAASLKPGGVLLLTVPGITPVDRGEWQHTWFWSLTDAALTRLLSGSFDRGNISVRSYGNVFAAVSFLQGLAQTDIPIKKLDVQDSAFPIVVAARVAKRGVRHDPESVATAESHSESATME
jgi:glycosyltransferase involved in cell wall biosynthesis/SAM-dependent methyltransferase